MIMITFLTDPTFDPHLSITNPITYAAIDSPNPKLTIAKSAYEVFSLSVLDVFSYWVIMIGINTADQ